MSNGDYAGLRLAARAGKPDPEDETMPETDEDEASAGDGKKKEDTMTEPTTEDAIAKARQEARAEANARFTSVLASDHYAGREALAQTLLGNDKLSADEIVAALAAAPKAAPAPTTDADDEAARAEMRNSLAAEQPASTAEAGDDPTTKEDDTLVRSMKARFPTAK